MPGDRTEAPTPRHLQQLRNRGQLAKSSELNTAIAILTAAAALRMVGPGFIDQAQELLRTTLLHPGSFASDTDSVRFLGTELALRVIIMVGPLLLAIMAAGFFSNFVQSGPLLTTAALTPKFSHINPMTGLRRWFSIQGFVELGKSIVKLALVGGVIYQAFWDQQGTLLTLLHRDLMASAGWIATLSTEIMLRIGAVFLVLSALDYLFQRWQFLQNAKMTREEVKEEVKSSEGSPEMRQRVRQAARALAMGRMMQAVPTADVIITNPTHLAIAIKYEMGSRAPRVIAKGPNLIAERIKQIARNAGVPIIENRPLAQALYKAADVGAEIPAALYQVVAEILAFVYRLKAPRVRMA